MKYRKGLFTLSVLLLSGCASSLYEPTPGVYQLEATNKDAKTGNTVKDTLIKQGKEFCQNKGGNFVLVNQKTFNAVPNYRPASAQIEFSCEFSFNTDRDYDVSQNEALLSREKYQKCLHQVISKIYEKTKDQDQIASLAFNICKPDMKTWFYAEGYANGKDKEEIEEDIQKQLESPTFGYEAILSYQRESILDGKIL